MRNHCFCWSVVLVVGIATNLSAGLIASYPFAEGSLDDSSGNGHTASVVGGSMTGAVTDPDRGEVFDLTGGGGRESAPGTYLELPVDSAGTGSWTMALWIHDGEEKNSYLFDNRDVVGSAGGAARLIFSTEHNTSGGIGLFNGGWAAISTAVRDGSWHHVAWAYDGGSGVLTLYMDGAASASAYAAADLLTATVRLGNRSGDGGFAQAGRLIDDVYVYDHSLSQTEIDDLIAVTGPPVAADPEFKITEVSRDSVAETVDLTWTSEEGPAEFEVLGAEDLTQPLVGWTIEASNIPNGGATTSTQLAGIDEDKKFFAVRNQQPVPPQLPFGDLALTPWPQSVVLDEAPGVVFDGDSDIFFDVRTTARSLEDSLEPLATVLAGEFEIVTGIKPSVLPLAGASPGPQDIVLEFSPVSESFAVTEAEEDQGYSLTVSDTGVSIISQYYKGVSYGTVTLLQLLEEDAGSYWFPAVQVDDEPDASYRGIMIDVARQIHSIGVLEDVVRLARLFKIRYIQLHLTDDQNFTFPFPPVTDNITSNFTYTREELSDLVAYADARGVTLIPEFDLPGHSSKLKASGYLDPSETDADVAHPDNYEKIQAIIDDMLSVFVSTPYFHMGGDESAAGGTLVPFLEAMNTHLRGTPTGGKRRMLVWEGFHGAPTAQLPATGDDRLIVLSWESAYNAPWNLLDGGYEVINASWKPTYVLSAFGTFYRDDVSVGKKWPTEVIYDWNKDRFMHWQPGMPVFEDRGPSDPDLTDHMWSATYTGKQEQVIGGQMQVWEQPETSLIREITSRLPVLAERLWNQEIGDFGEAFEDYDARAEEALSLVEPIVQPIEILPGIPAVANGTDEKVYEAFIPYEGDDLEVTIVNRTKIPGTIRYNVGGTSSSEFRWLFWRSIDDPSSVGTEYSAPFTQSGLFGVRARFILPDGTPFGGSNWNYFVNWENRVKVVEYDVNENVSLPVPDMTSMPADSIIREVEMPTLRGALGGVRQIGRLVTADITVPESGEHTFEAKTNNGHCNLYVDLDRNGVFEEDERLLTDTDNGDFWTAASPVELEGGVKYGVRIDHLQRLVGPRMAIIVSGPGLPNRNDITGLLSLPE